MWDFPAVSQACQRNFSGANRDQGRPVPDYEGERDELGGVGSRVSSFSDLFSEEAADTAPHRRRDRRVPQGVGGLDGFSVRREEGNAVGTIS